MKIILKFIIGLIALFALVVVGAGVYVASINPNDLKPLLISEVKKQTGRDLVISGDIQWQFFPTLGISVESLALKNPSGFLQENMVSFSRAQMSLEILPLLSKKISLGVARLDDANIFVQTLADGRNNLEFSPEVQTNSKPAGSYETKQEEKQNAAKTVTTSSQQEPSSDKNGLNFADWQMSLAGLAIREASAVILDGQTHSKINLTSMNLDIGKLGFDFWVPIDFDLAGQQNALAFTTKGKLELFLNQADLLASSLRNIEFDASAKEAGLKLETAKIRIDTFGLDKLATINLTASGEANELGFSTEGGLGLLLGKDSKRIELTNVDIKTLLEGDALPRKKMTLSLNAEALWEGKTKALDLSTLTLTADEIEVKGKADVNAATDIPKIRFLLESPRIDLDTFLGVKEEMAAKSKPVVDNAPAQTKSLVMNEVKNPAKANEPSKAQVPLSKVEPNLSALKGLDIAGKISINQFIAANIHVEKVIAQFAIDKGLVNVTQFDAALYGGSVTTKASLNANNTPATYSLTQKVANVQALPLLKDAIGEEILKGNGNININVTGKGLSPYQLRKNIAGELGISFKNGALYGINIPAMIREAKAALKGQHADYVKETAKTDFSALEASFTLGNGIAKTESVKLEAPLLRVHSEGQTDLITQSLDFDLFVSVVGTSKGQGGKDIDEVKNLTVPVTIFGSWNQPDYKIDLKSFLKANTSNLIENKLKEKTEKGLKKLLGDKANNEDLNKAAESLLKGLFN